MGLLLDLQATQKSADNHLQQLARFVQKLNAQVEEFRTKATREATATMRLPQDASLAERRSAETLMRNGVNRRVNEFRRELVQSSEAERTRRLQPLHDANTKAAAFRPLFQSPAQLLGQQGLGTPERTNLQQQLATAGPAELTTMRDLARIKGDKTLASAVLSRLDSMPTKSRPFGATEFSNEFVGDEFKAGKAAIAQIDESFQRAVVINREFVTGRTDATSRISLGLAAQGTTS